MLRVCENRVLRKVFDTTKWEVAGEWRKLHSDDIHDLYPPPNIVGVIKSGRIRWAGHVARMEQWRGAW